MLLFKFRLILNLFIFSVLCVSCRSSRTGTLSTYENSRALNLEGYERIFDKAEMAKLLSVHRDSLSIRITEYYPVLRGDTASRGSVRSETELHYSAVDTASKVVITAESIRERDSTFTIRETVSSEHKETSVSVRPWFDSWQFYLTAAAVIIIVLIIIRRFT